MPWKVSAPPDVSFVEVSLSGEIPRVEMTAAIGAIITEARASGRDLALADCSGFLGGQQLLDTYLLANARSKKTEHVFRKEAIVVPKAPKASQLVEFWKAYMGNHGFDVRSFSSRKAAIAWLVETKRPPEAKLA